MYYNPYALPLFVSAVALLYLAYRAWHYRSAPGARAFALLSVSNAVYSFFYALEISSHSLYLMEFWLRFQYIGIVAIPGFYLLFVLGYTGRSRWFKDSVVWVFFLVPFITLLLFWTNDYHHLIYQNINLNVAGLFPVIHFERGFWYWIHNTYTTIVVISSCILFMLKWRQAAYVYRKQVTIMLLGSLIPLTALMVYLLRPIPWNIDINPFALFISCLIFFFGLVRFRLFDLIPIAREKLFEELPDAVLFLDIKLRIVDLNNASLSYLPVTKESIGRSANDELQSWPELIDLLIGSYTRRYVELPRDIAGKACWFRIDLLPLMERETPYGLMVILREITARKRAEKMLQILATTDELTDLWNRRHFMETAGLEVERAKRYGQTFSLVMLDIDHFKIINDTIGHSAGDKALQHAASLIKKRIRENDIPGRLGGEEFCILLPGTDLEQAYILAEDLRREISITPFVYEGLSIPITASLGVSAYHQGVETIDDILKSADTAMYKAKAAGRNRIVKDES